MSEPSTPFDWDTADATPGNATREVKRVVYHWLDVLTSRGVGFGDRVGRRIKLTEISVNRMSHEQEKLEGKVVAEITIDKGPCKPGSWTSI
jgi:acyl-coenzyme A thioesterase 13